MVAGCLGATLAYRAIFYRCLVCERLVEDEHEVVFEVVGHTTAVLCGVAYYHVLLRHNLYIRPFVKRIDHYIRVVGLGEGETHGAGALGRCHLCHDVVVGEIYTIVVGLCNLCLM